MAKFNTLSSLYQMTSPADLSGKLKIGFGSTDQSSVLDAIMRILLDNAAQGAKDFKTIKKLINQITSKADDASLKQLKDVITILSTEGTIDALDPTYLISRPRKPNEDVINVTNLKQVIGNRFFSGENDDQSASIIISRSPYIHPSRVSTNKIDLFLNSMPPLVVARMVPYLELEFQVIRPAGSQISSPGTLKFLLGATDTNTLSRQDKAMYDGTKLNVDADGNEQYNFSGMEMFTSPQTLVNMDSLTTSGGKRYADVLDPFRPFASLENFEISVTPAVGMYTYKSARATIKVHDRTRLTEFSDLIRPKGYKDVVVWATYGWLAPQTDGDEYADYINKNMLRREAFGIVNSAFTFDSVGQVTVNLELFTKGVSQAKTALLTDAPTLATVDELRKIGEEIASYRKSTLKDPPEGFGADLRIYQLLDAAQAGEFPDFSTSDVNETISKLRNSLSKTSGFDKDALNKLIDLMKKFYANKDGKFDYQSQVQSTATKLIKDKFSEVFSGADPFLPTQDKADAGLVDPDLAREISKYNTETASTSVKEFQHKLVSFGKLFSTFIIPAIAAQRTVSEIQTYFYAMNEQTGPISMHSIAEFPIDMPVFMDQYRDMVVSRGGERVTIEEFLQLIINAQFLDNRAVGYGLRASYEPYDKKDRDPKIKSNQEQEFESKLAALTTKYGGFKMPNIEMHIEVMHRNNSDDASASDVDLLSQLDTSARNVQELSTADIKNPNKAYTIMRIHVYDKQLNPYKELGSMFRFGADGASFGEIDKGKVKSEIVERRFNQNTLSQQDFVDQYIQPKSSTRQDGYTLIGQGSAQTVRDYLLNTVPKITFGANGSTVLSANLSSKADPALSTINMLKNNRVQNTSAPNGAGDYGLPLRVVPAQLSLTTLGCPLAAMAQSYFCDFQTNTTLDNLYIVTGLSHTFGQGKFETNWTLSYADAYGRFTGAPSLIDLYQELVNPIDKK